MTEQLQLPEVPTKATAIPARPKSESYLVYSRIALELCTRLCEIDSEYGPPMDALTAEDNYDENPDWEKQDNAYGDVLRLLRDNYDWDGFALAKELDDCWTGMNAEMVAVLDDALSLKHTEHRKVVMRWVKQYELQPKYELNTVVKINVNGEDHTGVVTKIYPEYLQYAVAVAALGHGVPSATRGNVLGLVIDEEKILGLGQQTDLSKL